MSAHDVGDSRQSLFSSGAAKSAGLLLCALGLGYLFYTLVRQDVESMDFRYIWLAGRLWSEGLNPYGAAYLEAGAIWFPDGYAIASWAYPFHWFLIATLASLAPPASAFLVWLIVTTIALAGAFWAVELAARRLGAGLPLAASLLFAGYVASGSIVGYALRAGQPAVLAECGIALLLFGMATRRNWCTVVGLSLAMLKPQLGLPFATALACHRGGFRLAVIAAAVVLLASVPSFVASGLMPQLHGLLVVSQGSYQLVSYNSPIMMPGLPHLVWLATGHFMSITLSMLIAAAVTAGLSLWARRQDDPAVSSLLLPVLCLVTSTLIGLHTYDLVIALFAVPFLPLLGKWERIVALAALVVLWRTENMVSVTTGSIALIPTLQTSATYTLCGAFLAAFVRRPVLATR